VLFAMFAGFSFWWPKMTGRMLDDRLGKIHFWLTFIGFHLTFLIQHWLGVQGMPRRYADYLPEDGFTLYNQISTVGAVIMALSTLPFLYNVYKTQRGPRNVFVDDPWGFSNSLEWATSCPPPRHNFNSLPRIRSERPAFDLHHPEVAAMDQAEPDQGVLDQVFAGPDSGGRESTLDQRSASPRGTATSVMEDPEADPARDQQDPDRHRRDQDGER
ncbi:cbb3-type cytochrome c oxidase subunit I, partial [Georgenia sp. 10Sc9-8]|nr:cbb3-type cytochrome c oxidase subunit I [Georgenia halotolerans]